MQAAEHSASGIVWRIAWQEIAYTHEHLAVGDEGAKRDAMNVRRARTPGSQCPHTQQPSDELEVFALSVQQKARTVRLNQPRTERREAYR
jgi:hypothetical protein